MSKEEIGIWESELKDKGIEILSIKKRNWFARFLSIYSWLVVIRTSDKRVLRMRCWAGRSEFDKGSLFFDILRQTEEYIKEKEFLRFVEQSGAKKK